MSDRLTNEQLREFAECGNALTHQWKEVATELLAARAKLKAHGDILNEYSNHPVVRIITAKIASIK
jgi:hypothetical protein